MTQQDRDRISIGDDRQIQDDSGSVTSTDDGSENEGAINSSSASPAAAGGTQTAAVPEFLLRNISVEALLQVLLEKGVVGFDELKQAELQLRARARAEMRQTPPAEPDPALFPEDETYHSHGTYVYRKRRSHSRGGSSWLKRKMAKRRWTRRLGTLLFGWKWKRITKGAA